MNIVKNSDISKEEEARQLFVNIGTTVAILFQFSFSIWNFYNGHILEASLKFISVFPFIFALVLVHRGSTRHGYRLLSFVSIAVLICSLFYNQHQDSALMLGFFIYPMFQFRLLGLKEGSIWLAGAFSILLAICFLSDRFFAEPLSGEFIIRISTVYLVLSIFAGSMEWFFVGLWRELTNINNRLSGATDELVELSGLAPICSYCKKIKNDDGYWLQLEEYFRTNTSATISSGECADCSSTGQSTFHTPDNRNGSDDHALARFSEAIDKSKRQAVIILGLMSVAVIWFFSIDDFLNGFKREAFTQVGISMVFLVSAVFIIMKKHTPMFYQLVVVAIFMEFVQVVLGESTYYLEILWYFLFPLSAVYLLGCKNGSVWISVLSIFLYVIFYSPLKIDYLPFSVEFKLSFIFVYSFIAFLAISMEVTRAKFISSLKHKIDELKTTYDGIKTLKGIIPVCGSCKSVLNSKGFWTQLEAYLLENTELMLSHSICKKCFKENMPELYEEMKADGDLDPDK